MAELPEIIKLANQMRDTLRGKTIKTINLLQEKCANIPEDEFVARTSGAKIKDVYHKGKWIITTLNNGEHILLSLGMGADILYFEKGKQVPDKYQIKVLLSGGCGYKENKPCPVCGTDIVVLKTGSTSSYICPACQK